MAEGMDATEAQASSALNWPVCKFDKLSEFLPFPTGYGMMVLEQYKVQSDGTLLTRGPSNYKIPSMGNIPQSFNVTLLRESGSPKALYSSKGIGEPPLLLGASVLSAVYDAVRAARTDEGLDPFVTLDTPATPARIRMACSDRFIQLGYGMMVLEQYKVQSDGTLLTRGPSNYKIPSMGNIPQSFNVTLLRESGSPKALYSSKGIGEPPLLLGASVLSAVYDAVRAAQTDEGLDPFITLDTPATPARIRMACSDRFIQLYEGEEKKSDKKPWFVSL